MTSTLSAFKSSKAWDSRYDLPLVPMHNNPMIYSAYATKIIKLADGVPNPFADDIRQFNRDCEVQHGLFHRWPDGSGGVNSHDELMGAAYHNRETADEIVYYLDRHLGCYDNTKPGSKNLRYCVVRIPMVYPYLKSRADGKLSTGLQAVWTADLIRDMLTYKSKDEGGRLRIWIMLGEMDNYSLCKRAITQWKKKMHSKGLSPRACFEHYLKEVSVFRQYAPETF